MNDGRVTGNCSWLHFTYEIIGVVACGVGRRHNGIVAIGMVADVQKYNRGRWYLGLIAVSLDFELR